MSERRAHLVGWSLFVLCALCYLVAGWRSADPWSIGGSFVFLVGCVAFMVPLLRAPEGSTPSEADGDR